MSGSESAGRTGDHARALAGFRHTRARTLVLLDGLDQAQRDARPAPDRWSIGEIADHLLRSDAMYRDDIAELIALRRAGRRAFVRRSSRQVNTSVLGIPPRLFALADLPLSLFTAFLPRSVRRLAASTRSVRVQNPDLATPQPGRDASVLRAELGRSIGATAALIESNADLDYRTMIYQHPLMGLNNVIELLDFQAWHEQRHQRQLCEVLTADAFPAILSPVPRGALRDA